MAKNKFLIFEKELRKIKDIHTIMYVSSQIRIKHKTMLINLEI